MEKTNICPMCHEPVKIDYACGEYFAHCADGCIAPACFHSSESSTRLSWEDWAEWYARNHTAPTAAVGGSHRKRTEMGGTV